MNPETANFIISLAAIFFICVLVFWLYRDYELDVFRQKMFKLRDKLFDEARAGNISFDDDVYGILRSTMNGSIRYAHRMNFLYVVGLYIALKGRPPLEDNSFSERLKKKKSQLSDEQRKLIDKYQMKMEFYMLEHVLFSSPIILFLVLVPLAITVHLTTRVKQKVVKLFRAPLNELDEIAYTEGLRLS